MPSLYVVQYEIHRACVLMFCDMRWTQVKLLKERRKLYRSNLDTCVPAAIDLNRPVMSTLPP